ncbi:MAG: tetraacyldisaccharide 4'-kinase [Cytophagales bacterium]|nr:MAG: tetraacyldisaccharide 4'-kinase [Cytophagales bacterium]
MHKFLYLKFLLFPFALAYSLVMQIRSFLYARSFLKREKFTPFIISVGNLSVGGTGKTPHVEYLIKLFLSSSKRVAMLSRGYGRQTRGVIIADKSVLSKTIGDEPMQIYAKFGSKITLAVGEKRALAIPAMLKDNPQIEVIVLDDAFQHQAVNRNINILLTEYYRPFYCDFVVPIGRLREGKRGAKRADIVIVTKCPDFLAISEKETAIKKIKYYAGKEVPIFFTKFRYAEPEPLLFLEKSSIIKPLSEQSAIVLLTGIANPSPMVNYLKGKYHIEKHFDFADHFEYSENALKQLLKKIKALNLPEDYAIITTEKDSVKLQEFGNLLAGIPIFYLPVEVVFLENEEKFIHLITKNLTDFKNL